MNGPEVGFFLGLRDVFDEPSCSELAFWSSAASVIWSLAVGSFIQFALTAGSRTPQLVASPAGGGGGARTPPSEFCWIFFFGRRWAKQAGFAAYRTYTVCVCVCAAAMAAGCWLGTWRHNYWLHETFIENIYELIDASLFFLITDSYVSSWLLLGAE